jgi:MerR family transcriptional regulator, light-induced transcriptional regulator
MEHSEPGVVRIGELSRRVGVSDHVLRAWETRYGLLRPTRSAGGFRLYSAADERRVRRMRHLMSGGLSAAEAAHAVAEESAAVPLGRGATTEGILSGEIGQDVESLWQALDAFDEPAAQTALDRLLSGLSVPTVLRDIVLPYLHELGRRWEQGTVSVAQEHFASNVIRGRLAGLARGWGAGTGPKAVLACPPDEMHDLSLMAFGIVLNRLGWNVTYLGSNTPVSELARTVDATRPDLVVLAATVSARFKAIAAELRELGRRSPLALAGAGASFELAEDAGARFLAGDPVAEAEAFGRAG